MILLVFLLAIALPLALLKYLGMRAMRIVSITVGGLTLEQLVEVGTKSSHSFPRKVFGKPKARRTANGGAQWDIRSKAGVMTVHVAPLPGMNGAAFEVSAAATDARKAQVRGDITLIEDEHGEPQRFKSDWDAAKGVMYLLFRALGIPENPRKLLRQRRRVLRAIRKAGQEIPADSAQRQHQLSAPPQA